MEYPATGAEVKSNPGSHELFTGLQHFLQAKSIFTRILPFVRLTPFF